MMRKPNSLETALDLIRAQEQTIDELLKINHSLRIQIDAFSVQMDHFRSKVLPLLREANNAKSKRK